MTKQEHNGAHLQDPDADRLGAAWNEITAGRIPSYENGPTELIAAAELLHAETPGARPRPRFKSSLRETLMDTALPNHKPAPIHLPRKLQDPIAVTSAAWSGSRESTPVRGLVTRWLAIAASVALLVTTVLGAYLGGVGRSNDGPGSTNTASQLPGTPEAIGSPFADPCEKYGPYLLCGPDPWVVSAPLEIRDVSADALAVSQVQLQGWELEGAASVSYSAPASPLTGVGVDVVVAGAYRATFDSAVTVTRPIVGGGSSFERPDAGVTIELSSGDSVTYLLGAKREVSNAHDGTRLHFKTIFFYEGDPSAENLVVGGQFATRVDGDGELPMPVSDYEHEVRVLLSYIHLFPGQPFPPEEMQFTSYVLGPVASTLVGGGPDEGFVIWFVSAPTG